MSLALVTLAGVLGALPVRAVQEDRQLAAVALPDDPSPQNSVPGPSPHPNPCPPPAANSGDPGLAPSAALIARPTPVPCAKRGPNWYDRFVDGPKDKPLTPRDKAWLAARGVLDPFNLITIAGEAGIAVAVDSHSPYGPGMSGYGRYVGVSFAEDLTGEFFGTYAIPSIAHQDPHYYRMEHARLPRRFAHAVVQVFWTKSDSGKPMLNYANLIGFGFDDAIANLYVPGRETAPRATADRYAIALASAPIGNFVNEFLPDVASHIHVQIVILQRIINQVARSETSNSQ